MARIRTIKPQFFLNEDLARLEFSARLLFVGLWTIADREGRLEDRPARIRAALFPYDEIDVDAALVSLADGKFITRYVVGERACIAIPTFTEHQRPNHREPASTLPAPGSSAVSSPSAANADAVGLRPTARQAVASIPDLSAYLDALKEIHPKFGREFGVANALAEQASQLPPLEQFVEVLTAWAESRGWTKEDGEYAPSAATWVREGGFKNAPKKPRPTPTPARTVDQVRADDVKPALLSALKAKRLDRPTHDALLDRAAAATTIPELEAILREVPHAAA